MEIDIKKMPFTRYGSYFCLNWLPNNPNNKMKKEDHGLYLRNIHWVVNSREIFKIDLLDGERVLDYDMDATPSVLKLIAEKGQVEFCFSDTKTIRIRGKGVSLRLKAGTGEKEGISSLGKMSNDKWLLNNWSGNVSCIISRLKGNVRIEDSWDMGDCIDCTTEINGDNSDEFEIALDLYTGTYQNKKHEKSFEECVREVKQEFAEFLEKSPQLPEELASERKCAAYLNWSSIVEPYGNLDRYGMYMSKNWMLHIFSWDHCFNAIALSYKNPELAWDQLMILFDYQDENGAIPDRIDDGDVLWNFSKPPIHGWTLQKMMENTDFIDHDKKKDIYEPLSKWTDWWFAYRDFDQNGIPQYNHGNDSGWDNSTIFQKMYPIESPDLSAFLVIQMEVLSTLAADLGKESEAESWQKRADELLEKMLDHFWTDNGFKAVYSGSDQSIQTESLILYLPLILGKRLSEERRDKLVTSLQEKGFITEYGPATEAPGSDSYEEDGYWRGPIWAPSTMLLIDGLYNAGKKELATEIAGKFVKTVTKSGFAENFNALTGDGLRDPAYTWTSSVFLILAHEYLYL